MDKLLLPGRYLGQVFNSRGSNACTLHWCCYEVKLPNLKLKAWTKQLRDSPQTNSIYLLGVKFSN
jgi:hypothetical protein